MTTRELIKELLNCPMDAEVDVLVEIKRDVVKERMMDMDGYSYTFEDDIPVASVDANNRVRINLEEIKD